MASVPIRAVVTPWRTMWPSCRKAAVGSCTQASHIYFAGVCIFDRPAMRITVCVIAATSSAQLWPDWHSRCMQASLMGTRGVQAQAG